MLRTAAAILSILFLIACSGPAPAPEPEPSHSLGLVAVQKVSATVGFYKMDGELVKTVKVGEFPHEMITSSDGKLLYVSDNGVLWMTETTQGFNTISIIDLASREKVGVIDLGEYRRPHGMDVIPQTGNLVVTIENPDGLLLVDPVAKKVLRKYDTKGASPHMVKLGPRGEYAYASNTGTATLAAIHLETGDVKLIKVGERPQGSTLSHDGKLMYLTCSDGNSIAIIDMETQEVVGEIATGEGPGRIALTPDGSTLVYNLQAGNGCGFADVATRKEVARVDLEGPPLSLSLSRDGAKAYLGVQSLDKIFVVSVAEKKVIQVIDVPKDSGPDPVMEVDL